MDVYDIRGEIAELEDEIEVLRDVIERCRKIMLAGKAAIAGGALLLLAQAIGVLHFEPISFMAASAGLLGGIVLFGSNNSTAREKIAALKAAETRRATLIDAMPLRVVGGSESPPLVRWLH
jgi:hypothetical protein